MGLRWCLEDVLARRGWGFDELEARSGLMLPDWMSGSVLPEALPTATIAALCEALDCEPGELLAREIQDPAEQAARALEADLGYQSFLAYARAREEAEPPSDPA